jgi:hypothetical protein
VTGFSTNINDLPSGVPIWIRIAARNSCTIGYYGNSTLVGNPSLPTTGFAPRKFGIIWYLLPIILAEVSIALFLVLGRRKIA